MANESYLEIPLTQFQNISNFKKLVDIRVEKGCLVDADGVRDWSFIGYRYRDGQPVIYGPQAAGVPLGEALQRPREQALAGVLRVIRALIAAGAGAPPTANAALSPDLTRVPDDQPPSASAGGPGAEGSSPGVKIDISPDSVWVLDDGGVLFLPAEVFRKLRLLSQDDYKAGWSRMNNPYLEDGQAVLSHAVGVLLYRVFTGVFPYDGATLDEIHTHIRHQRSLPAQFYFPELKERISDTLRQFLDQKLPLTLADWEKAVSGWVSGGFSEPRGEDEKRELAERRAQHAAQSLRRVKRGVFWEKYGKTVALAAAGVLAAGVIAGSFVSNALKPRRTVGFPPLKIVQTYYQCLNDLNPELMRDCLKSPAGEGEVQRTEVMFVNTRQMMAVANEDYRIPAGLWEQSGRRPVEPPLYLDGVSGLAVTEESGGKEWVFGTAYERWLREPDKNDPKGPLLQNGYRMRERLTLVKDDQGWLIAKIERREETLIYSDRYGFQPGRFKPDTPPAAP